MNTPQKPLAVTMGDPAGVGGEIVIKAWQCRLQEDLPPFFYIGPPECLSLFNPDIPLATIQSPEEAATVFQKALPVLPLEMKGELTPGVPNTKAAPLIMESIQQAVGYSKTGSVHGLVTLPIHKASLYEAGFKYKGHTDYLAFLTGKKADDAIMMLANNQLRTVPLTQHVALAEVPRLLTQEHIIKTSEAILKALEKQFGITNPRLAITGLNPHAGENGALGKEETDIIEPAIRYLQEKSYRVTGPEPADTCFTDIKRNTYDAVLAMYHDQALIPLKTLDFRTGVNITLGLPIIRTSPDHGTAFDIAGKGIADPASLIAAIKVAATMKAPAP